jgi:NADPH2:quinone reductase
MKAVRIHEHGGPEVLRVEEPPTPDPGPGQALVRVEASGVNALDLRHRSGASNVGDLPATLGLEGAGVIEALGSDTDGFRVGDRVAWYFQKGSYASHLVVSVDGVVPLPDAITSQTAAAVMMHGLTAHCMACSAYALEPGMTCLVQSANGGVAGFITQIAKLRGARVIGTVSKEDRVAAARQVGADDVVYSQDDVAESVRRLTDGEGVDVVYDGVGKDTFDAGLAALRPLGYMVVYGEASGPIPPVDTRQLGTGGGRFLTRGSLAHYVTDRAVLLKRAGELLRWVEAGEIAVRIGAMFPLDEAARAHEALESRTVIGKALLLDA